MLILLFTIFLILAAVGYVLYKKYEFSYNEELSDLGFCIFYFSLCAEIIVVFFIFCTLFDISYYQIIDKKISMYQIENKNIEEQVTEVVNEYKDYEQETIKNVGQMSSILIKIPELKSNELVSKQIQVYMDNNNKIKKLKEEKIDIKISEWWLYFGK